MTLHLPISPDLSHGFNAATPWTYLSLLMKMIPIYKYVEYFRVIIKTKKSLETPPMGPLVAAPMYVGHFAVFVSPYISTYSVFTFLSSIIAVHGAILPPLAIKFAAYNRST